MYNQETLINILKKIQGERSLNKFAEDINVDSAYLSRIFNYKRTNPPTPDILKKMADNSRGLTTYMELMIICGYITHENIEEKTRILSTYNDIRNNKITLEEKLKYVKLTKNEEKIANNYINEVLNSVSYMIYNSKENKKIFDYEILNKKLSNIKKIKDIDTNKVYYYCLGKITLGLHNLGFLLQDKELNPNNLNIFLDTKNYSSLETIKIPVVGTVAAGEPILAEQNIIDYEELPANEFQDGEYFRFENQTEIRCFLVFWKEMLL